jgi:hypothetical protein
MRYVAASPSDAPGRYFGGSARPGSTYNRLVHMLNTNQLPERQESRHRSRRHHTNNVYQNPGPVQYMQPLFSNPPAVVLQAPQVPDVPEVPANKYEITHEPKDDGEQLVSEDDLVVSSGEPVVENGVSVSTEEPVVANTRRVRREGTPVTIRAPAVDEGRSFLFPRFFKKALQIGINYEGTNNELHGCIEDIDNTNRTFANLGIRFGESVVMTDHTTNKPTKQNIINGIKWLVDGATIGDTLWFQYSGHGSHQRATNDAHEDDDQDESLCPIDMDTAGMLLDNEIQACLSLAPAGCKIFVFCDCCHSGTNCDLPYILRINERQKPKRDRGSSRNKPRKHHRSHSREAEHKQSSSREVSGDIHQAKGRYVNGQFVYRQEIVANRFGVPTLTNVLYQVFTTIMGIVFKRIFTGAESMLGHQMVAPVEPVAPAKVVQTRPENCKARIISLSGCKDDQTSQEFDGHGAMTTVFMELLAKLMQSGRSIKMTDFLAEVYTELTYKGTPQLPQICSSFKLSVNDSISFAL